MVCMSLHVWQSYNIHSPLLSLYMLSFGPAIILQVNIQCRENQCFSVNNSDILVSLLLEMNCILEGPSYLFVERNLLVLAMYLFLEDVAIFSVMVYGWADYFRLRRSALAFPSSALCCISKLHQRLYLPQILLEKSRDRSPWDWERSLARAVTSMDESIIPNTKLMHLHRALCTSLDWSRDKLDIWPWRNDFNRSLS